MRINRKIIDIYTDEFPVLMSKLRRMSREERTTLFQKKTNELFPMSKRVIDLEDQIRGHKDYIQKFKRAFFVVGNSLFSSYHWGEYLQSKFCSKLNTTSQRYAQKVVLSLALMGYITNLQTGYCKGKHGYIYNIDLSKVKNWFSEFSDVIDDLDDDLEEDDDLVDVERDASEITNVTQDDINSWGLTTQADTISKMNLSKEFFEESEARFMKLKRNSLPSNFGEYKKLHPESKQYEYEQLKQEETRKIMDFTAIVSLYNHLKKCYRFTVDSYSGRCHTLITRMKTETRREITLNDNKFKEVDISACQPTLLGLIALRDNPNIKSEWLEHCLKGDFYEWVTDITNLMNGYPNKLELITTLEYQDYHKNNMSSAIQKMKKHIGDANPYKFYRPMVKSFIMTFLFSKTSIKSMEKIKDNSGCLKRFQYNLITYLKSNEPEIYNIIVWSRDKKNLIPKSKDPTKKSSPLPKKLQQEEVIFMKSVIQNLSNIDYFYTVHDCIGCLESDAEKVKQIMEQTSMDMYGFKLHFKIE
jgi:hypothetical protein